MRIASRWRIPAGTPIVYTNRSTRDERTPVSREKGYLSAVILTLVATGIAGPGPAWASGQLPPVTLPPRTFASFDACVAELEAQAKEHKGQATPVIPMDDGGTRQTIVQTKGVIRQGNRQAIYDAEVGFIGRTDLRKDIITAQYSWIRYHYACAGAVMTGTSEQGYDMSSIEHGPEKLPVQ
jgi:hypothetical protein